MAFESVYLEGFGGKGVRELTKPLTELQGLTISGPLTGATANTAITVPEGITSVDTIIKVLEFASGTFTDQTSHTTIVSDNATGTLTLSGVVAGDTCVVGGTTLTFATFTKNNSNSPAPGIVPVGGTDTLSAANLAQAITNQIKGVAATASGTVVTITELVAGTAGNSVTLVGDAHITASGATLAGGSTASTIKISVDTSAGVVFVVWYNKAP